MKKILIKNGFAQGFPDNIILHCAALAESFCTVENRKFLADNLHDKMCHGESINFLLV